MIAETHTESAIEVETPAAEAETLDAGVSPAVDEVAPPGEHVTETEAAAESGEPDAHVETLEAAASDVSVKPEADADDAVETLTDDEEAPAASAEAHAPAEKKKWYIVKVQSGRENSIKNALERRVKIEGLEEYVGSIKIPVEKVSELRAGKRIVRERKKFPGYLMVNVEFNDRVLYLFRETSGVGDFVGGNRTGAAMQPPLPMPENEVQRMLADDKDAAEGGRVKPKEIKLKFGKGDRVRVRDGTFSGMEGEVKEIVEPKDVKDTVRVRVELTIFGRGVPVEVEAWQVDPV